MGKRRAMQESVKAPDSQGLPGTWSLQMAPVARRKPKGAAPLIAPRDFRLAARATWAFSRRRRRLFWKNPRVTAKIDGSVHWMDQYTEGHHGRSSVRVRRPQEGHLAGNRTRVVRGAGRIIAPVIMFPTLLVALGTTYLLTGAQRIPTGQPTQSGGRLIRTGQPRTPRPATLDPAMFSEPDVRLAYQAAKEIPEILENLPCYCGCFSNSGHRNNLDCFHDAHGEECLMCRAIALEAQQQRKLGVSLPEIKKRIDEKWSPRAQPPDGN